MIEYIFEVKWGDTDAAGIVFYPNFYKWMDEATHHFFSELGFPSTKLFQEQVGLPLLEAKCQFQSPLHFGDKVSIHSFIIERKDKMFTIEHVIQKNDEKIASGYEKRVWAHIKNGQPKAVSIPDNIKEVMSLTQSAVH